jgi:hypothetical protein
MDGAIDAGGFTGTGGVVGAGGATGLDGATSMDGSGGLTGAGTGGIAAGGSGGTRLYTGGANGTGGVGGTGGATSTATAGSTGNCGMMVVSTTRQPADVLLVLDRSSSMDYSTSQDCYCTAPTSSGGAVCADTTNCATRWQGVQAAVTNTLANTVGVNWGLKLFSTPTGASQCTVSSSVEVPIGPDSASSVSTMVQNVTLGLGTPTTAALMAATAYLKTVNDTGPKAILLATDGEPNCGGTPASMNIFDLAGAASAAAAANAAGFPVYVVGIGPNLDNLTQLAQAGGTGDYYSVSSSPQLVDAFTSISNLVASCTFILTSMPPDPNNIGIYLDKSLVPKDDANGWSFGASTQSIVLNGSRCDQVTSGAASTVSVLFGCPGGPPFPLVIP